MIGLCKLSFIGALCCTTLKRNLHAHNKNFATLLVNMGKTVRKARITSKQRRSWCAREKLMVVCYHEHGHSVKKTAEKFNIQRKQVCDWKSKRDLLIEASPHLLKLLQGEKGVG